MHYVYIIRSLTKPSSIYIGQAQSVIKRLSQHNKGITYSTRNYRPWKLVYYEAYLTLELAKLREQRLKHHGNALKELKKRIGL